MCFDAKHSSRFAHLISVDFFRDLLEAMKQVMNAGNTLDSEQESNFSAADTRRRLLCSITAFQLLSGQGNLIVLCNVSHFDNSY
jgi:nucleolar complex protein 3